MTQALRRAVAAFDRTPLLTAPTPIQRLQGLERALDLGADGPRLYVKRDDLGDVGGGGNKLRKLEFLLGEAVATGCRTFITTGGLQSNHARLSAAAAARTGLACELFLARFVPRDDEDYRRNGNVLLDGLFGATVHELPGDADPLQAANARADALRALGERPYVVGAGGSSPVGCLGYAVCAAEILEQEAALGLRFERILVPNGSGGTHAGLAAGLRAAGDDPARVLSFTTLAPLDAATAATLQLSRRTLSLMHPSATIDAAEVVVSGEQRGSGYGVPTQAMLDAVRLLARTEGLLLDPVYSGKAFAGFLAQVRAGAFAPGAAVLFIMTGGVPGLFAYRRAFDPDDG